MKVSSKITNWQKIKYGVFSVALHTVNTHFPCVKLKLNATSKITWLQCALFQRRDTSKMLVSQGKGQKSLLSNNFWAPSIGKTFLWVKWS